MALRHIPMTIRVFFSVGFCIALICMATSYYMMAQGTWEQAADWVRFGTFLICPAMLGLMSMDGVGNAGDHPPGVAGYAVIFLAIALYNGILYGAVGFAVEEIRSIWIGKVRRS